MTEDAAGRLHPYDLVIVGAGIPGLTLALALRGSGLRIAVVDALAPEQAAQRSRVYALTLLTQRIWQGIGFWSAVAPRLQPFHTIHLSDTGQNVVRFRPQDGPRCRDTAPVIGYVGEHQSILPALQAQVGENVDWYCPAELVELRRVGRPIHLLLRHQGEVKVLSAPLVVGADGAHSPVRQWAGIPTWGWGYWQSCLTTVLEPQFDHGGIAYERFWPSGPFAILPLPAGRCGIVWTIPHAEAHRLRQSSLPSFLNHLASVYGPQMGELQVRGERQVFPVRLMQARRYVAPGVALIGDAAHGCHPVGGQGLNLGIRDAASLAQILREAVQQGEDIGHLRVLRRYQRWRWPENLWSLLFTDLLNRVFSNQFWPLVILRRLGLWLLRVLAPVRRLALAFMTGYLGRPHRLNDSSG